MNTVILTSVLSAGNHALFAGTRVLYGLAVTRPAQAPSIFAYTTRQGVPLFALAATSSISALCFGSSFVGNGELWSWLQNIVGVSNQVRSSSIVVVLRSRASTKIAWLSIGLASWRFRRAWIRQGRPLSELKFRASWTWPWGPPFVVITVAALIISEYPRITCWGFTSTHFARTVQGWSSVIPTFSAVDFVSFYVEIPVLIIMYIGYMLIRRPRLSSARIALPSEDEPVPQPRSFPRRVWGVLTYNDQVDITTVDLQRDEHNEEPEDAADDQDREAKLHGRWRWFWKVYYAIV